MSSPAVVSRPHVAVIGGGFCGLAAAYELGRRGGIPPGARRTSATTTVQAGTARESRCER